MAAFPRKSAPPLLRLGHPLAFAAFLRRAGAPVDRHLRASGLPILCADPDAFVPLTRAWGFFDTAARREDPALGWLVGRYVGDHSLNAGMLRQLEAAPTLLQALRQLIRLSSTEASHLKLGIKQRRNDILLYTHYPHRREIPGYQVSQAYQMGVLVDLIRHFAGRCWVPDEMGIEASHIPAAAHTLVPGSRILTQQQMGYIAVPRAYLHCGPHRAKSEGDEADGPVLSKEFDYIETLRALLESYLAEGYPSARFAAALMDTSERTLARKLSASGVTYRTLLDEVRFGVAKRLLQKPGERIGDIGRAVGFDDQSHFTRMFRRIGGLSPREFRKAIQS